MDKLSIVPEPSLKSAHEGESVEAPNDDISMDPGELPMATASRVRDIRAATMMFEAEHKECIRVLPFTKDGQIVVQFYVYSGESGIPKDLRKEAQTFFEDMHVKLEWSDLYNDSVNILNVQRLEYPFGKPTPLTASQVDEMNEVIEKHLPELSKHRNITSLQASLKITNSQQTDQRCITIYVLGKGLIPFGDSVFPVDLEGYRVDVVNGFWRRAVLIDTQEAQREAQEQNDDGLKFGASIGVQGKLASGTLGAIVKSGSTYYALSCDHVMKSEESSLIVHPGHYDHLKYLKYSLRAYIGWLERLPNVKIDGKETEKKLKDLSSKEELIKIFQEMKSIRTEYECRSTDETKKNVAANKTKKNVADMEKAFEERLVKPPRVIGEYVCGFNGNVKWTDGNEYYIDAAVAKLSYEEVNKIGAGHWKAQLYETLLKPGTECIRPENTAISKVNKVCKSGRTTGYTETCKIFGAIEPPQFILECSQSELDGPFLTSSGGVYFCENCRRSCVVQFESGAPRHCIRCNQIEKRMPENLCFKRCLCIQDVPSRPFASDGDSGSVIFEKPEEKGNLKGLGLLFGLLEHQYRFFLLASPLQVVLEAFKSKLPDGSGLELVGNSDSDSDSDSDSYALF